MQQKKITNTIYIIFTFVFFSSLNLFSNNLENSCDEFYNPGLVAEAQVLCLSDNDPAPINSIESASNGVDEFEYLWIFATADPNQGTVVWLSIPGATGKSYDPPALFQTTWFRRCTRPIGCASFGAESNIVKITIEQCTEPCDGFKFGEKNIINPNCHNKTTGKIEVEVIGGAAPYVFNWSHTETHNAQQENLGAGIYDLVVSDVNGCTIATDFELIEPEAMKVSFEQKNVTCFNGNNGHFDIKVEGGTAPFSFKMQGNIFENNSFENLSAGNYSVVILDENGCIEEAEILIEEPAQIEVTSQVFHESCHENDGNIQLEIIGGTAPFEVSWNNGTEGQQQEYLEAGAYHSVVIDAHDCFAYQSFDVLDNCEDLVIDFQQGMIEILESEEVKISWKTQNEKAGGVYLIERSLDGENFEIISESLTGKGFQEVGSFYEFMDIQPKNGMNFYRINHISKEGEFSISESFSIYMEKEDLPKIAVFPNPVVNQVSIDFLKPKETTTAISISNSFGQIVFTKNLEIGNRFYDLDVDNLPSGTYFLNIQEETGKGFIQTIMKE